MNLSSPMRATWPTRLILIAFDNEKNYYLYRRNCSGICDV